MAFDDLCFSVSLECSWVFADYAFITSKASLFRFIDYAFLFFHQIDNRVFRFMIYFCGVSTLHIHNISGKFNYGTLHSKAYTKKWNIILRANFTVNIFPSIPLDPKPGATTIPLSPLSLSATFFSVISSEWMNSRSTRHSFAHRCEWRILLSIYKHPEVPHIFLQDDLNRISGILQLFQELSPLCQRRVISER